jgi:hypothetical protein
LEKWGVGKRKRGGNERKKQGEVGKEDRFFAERYNRKKTLADWNERVLTQPVLPTKTHEA